MYSFNTLPICNDNNVASTFVLVPKMIKNKQGGKITFLFFKEWGLVGYLLGKLLSVWCMLGAVPLCSLDPALSSLGHAR